MLAETVDTGLWQAQRVLQSASTSAVDLSGCDALSRALDVAAGDAADLVGLSGTEPLLIEKIDAEYGRYFTATGRPTGGMGRRDHRAGAAEADVAQCAAAVAEVRRQGAPARAAHRGARRDDRRACGIDRPGGRRRGRGRRDRRPHR